MVGLGGPGVAGAWLDGRRGDEMPRGGPRGAATTRPSAAAPNASVWSRAFGSGTHVEFDGGSGVGTVFWASRAPQVGPPTNLTAVANGCRWESM